MPSELSLIFPLLGGFYFVFRCQLVYLMSLQLGQATAVLLSALVGAIFAQAARIVVAVVHIFTGGSWVEIGHSAAWPFQFAGTAMVAFWLAVLAAEVSRWALNAERVNSWFIRNVADDRRKLLYLAMLELRPVCLTLESGKVYIGFIGSSPSLDPDRAFIRLLPILSGFRTPEMTLRLTTEYARALEAAERPANMMKVIPLAKIETANLFDVNIYTELFGGSVPPQAREQGQAQATGS